VRIPAWHPNTIRQHFLGQGLLFCYFLLCIIWININASSYRTHPSILQELQDEWHGGKLPLFAFLCRVLLLSQELYTDFSSSPEDNDISSEVSFLDILLRICIGTRNRRMDTLQTPVDSALAAANVTLNFAFSPNPPSFMSPETSMYSSQTSSSSNLTSSSNSFIPPTGISLADVRRARENREHFESHPVHNLWPTYAKLGIRTPAELPEEPNKRRCQAWRSLSSDDPLFIMRLRAIGRDCVFLRYHKLYPVPFGEIYDMCIDLIEFGKDPEGRYTTDVKDGARMRLRELLQHVLPLDQNAWPKVRDSLRTGQEGKEVLQKTSYAAYVQCHLALDKSWGQHRPFHDPLLEPRYSS
jgi:hypothetical protein